LPVKQIEYPCNGTRRLAQRTTAFQRALRSDEPIELRNIKIRNNNGDFNYATITIKQIESPDQLKGMVLIVFKEEREVQPHLSQQKNSKLPLSETERT
jgi:two-component system CheB/CheR fusion protein